MDLILIPGAWLDASSWDQITPALEAAGHRVHAMTLPGLESVDADRSGIGLADHIDAVVKAVDAIDAGEVVLVGHSAGGAIAYGVTDRRLDRVARVVYVDSVPLGERDNVNDHLPVVDGEVPLPDWDVFDDEDVVDLDDPLRAAFRTRAIPEPLGVLTDPQRLSDERRYDVPGTVIACEYPAAVYRDFIAKDADYTRELARLHNYEIVDLPTGHWPQFTKPAELAAVIGQALS
jgi:pimeloyl-ACP methyl ester carboxylesterase